MLVLGTFAFPCDTELKPMPITAAGPTHRLYADHVNPQWVRLLDLLDMNVQYEKCVGCELFTHDGARILDFLSGYCVHNTGHNHPRIIAALHAELDRNGPAMLQSHVSDLAGELAARLCELGGSHLRKVFFASSGSEGIETAIKFARARTGRAALLYAQGAFHGLTCGALSLMDNGFWRQGFGPLLSETEAVPFGDVDLLAQKLSDRQFAAFVIEPIQAEGGIRLPHPEYLAAVQELCRRTGTLLVLDEVQTGMHRTGPFLAAHRYGLQPDMVVLAKALSGGLVPAAAVLMTDEVYGAVYTSLQRALVHTSTFSENGLSLRAGIATLDVLEQERLGERAERLGSLLRERLRHQLGGYEMVSDIRGAGLLCGIEFRAPQSLGLRLPFEAFARIHPGMFGQMLVRRLFREENILTQICGNHFMVLKAAPPLVVTEEQIEHFVRALKRQVEFIHSSRSFWADALGLARRALNI